MLAVRHLLCENERRLHIPKDDTHDSFVWMFGIRRIFDGHGLFEKGS